MRIDLTTAADLLKHGEVIAIPTETVYGLAASIKHEGAIRRVFELKGRPADNPLIVHVANFTELKQLARDLPEGIAKIGKFWPGPLTVVVAVRAEIIPAIARAGLLTVAVRVPDHPLALEILSRCGPVVAPSANLSGRPSPTTPAHVEADFGADFPVLDGGPCRDGVESTIIQITPTGWRLLRSGATSPAKIAAVFGVTAGVADDAPTTPGQKHRHYAPRARLVPCRSAAMLRREIAAKHANAVLGFTDSPVGDLPLMSLGRRGDFGYNLQLLYANLRALDDAGYARVLVDLDFASAGLGVTLMDRLVRACRK